MDGRGPKKWQYPVLLVISIFLSSIKDGKATSNMFDLITDLTASYEMVVKPSPTPTTPINVRYDIALQQIIDMDERNQVLTTNVWLRQYWTDFHLQWNPDEYGGITKITLPSSNVWTPDILLYNTADDAIEAIMQTNVEIQHDGNVTWYAPAVFKSSCKINIMYFPVDEQHCIMQFGSWSYGKSALQLTNRSSTGDISSFIDNGEWELRGMPVELIEKKYSCCEDLYPVLEFTVIIGRRSFFYIFNLIFPCMLVTALTILTFYLPAHAYEKLTLCLTVLLSLAVFLLMVAETTPPTSEVVPIISQYFLITMIIVSLSTLVSVIVLQVHHRGGHEGSAPEWLRKLAFDYLEPVLCLTRCCREERPPHSQTGTVINHLGGPDDEPTYSTGGTIELPERKLFNKLNSRKSKVHSLLDTVGELLQNVFDSYNRQDAESKVESDWIRIGYVIDRIALWFFTLFTLFFSCIYLYKSFLASHH